MGLMAVVHRMWFAVRVRIVALLLGRRVDGYRPCRRTGHVCLKLALAVVKTSVDVEGEGFFACVYMYRMPRDLTFWLAEQHGVPLRERLAELAQLLSEGLISTEEHDAARKAALGI